MILRILLTLLILTYSPGLANNSTLILAASQSVIGKSTGCRPLNRDTVYCDSISEFNGTSKNLLVQDCSFTALEDSFSTWPTVTNITFNCTVENLPWSLADRFPNIKFINLPFCNLKTLSWQKVFTETLKVLDLTHCPIECACENQWMKADGTFERVKEPLTLRKCIADCDPGILKLNQTMIIGNSGENVTIHVDIEDRFLNRSFEKPYFEWAYAKNQHNYQEVITRNSAELIIINLTRSDMGYIAFRCWHCVNYLTNIIELRVNLPVKVEFVEKTRGDTDLLVVQGYPIDNVTLRITQFQLQSNLSQFNILDLENDSVYFSSLIVRPEKRSIFYQRTYRIFTKDSAEGDHLSGDLRFEVCTTGSCDSVEKHVSHLGTSNTEIIIVPEEYNDMAFFIIMLIFFVLVTLCALAIYFQKKLRTFLRQKIVNFRKRISWAQEMQSRRASQETEQTLLRLEERSSLASEYANVSIPFIEMGLIQIHEKIGSGQFGDVYAASWEKTGERSLAVKALKQFDSELEKEARTLFRLDHPNIVKMFGMTRDTKSLLIVFEHMNLGDLRTYLTQRKPTGEYIHYPPGLTPLEVKKIVFEVIKGVKYLVEQQVVHRDLAARNCLVSGVSDELCRCWEERKPIQVKISDFGMSRRLYSSMDYYTMDPKGAVPIRWLAPESIRQQKFTFSSDIWSLGVTMWECYSFGATPYGDMSNLEVGAYTIKTPSEFQLKKPLHCPQNMFSLMEACWQQDPTERITAAQLASHPVFNDFRFPNGVPPEDPVMSSDIESAAVSYSAAPPSQASISESGFYEDVTNGGSSATRAPLLSHTETFLPESQEENLPIFASA